MEIYLLACESIENGGGIYRYDFTKEGKLNQTGYLACDKPMYAKRIANIMHVLLKQPFQGSNESGYCSIKNFSEFSEIKGSKGVCACHLDVEGEDLYLVNYLSGNVVKNGEIAVAHEGKGVHTVRQDMPHTHYVSLTPDKKYLIVTDLGIDTLFLYDRDLNEVCRARVPDGYGIRHCVFSKDGTKIYVMNELIAAISVFSYTEGKIEYLYTQDIPTTAEKLTGAAIRLSSCGKYLFCSIRGENTLHSFKIEDSGFTELSRVDCHGDSPRDINLIDDKFLIACNEKSNNAVVFKVEDGKIGEVTDEVEIVATLNCEL